MIQEPLLSIIILSCNRLDLLRLTINSLLTHLNYPHWEMIIYNHKDLQEKGLIKLLEMVRGKYILHCEDDWFFLPMAKNELDWIQKGIGILEKYPEIKFVLLRQDEDGQVDSPVIRNLENGFEVEGGCFGLNPFIAKTETIKNFFKEAEKDIEPSHNIERKLWEARTAFSLKGEKTGIAKLSFRSKWNRHGVCIHTGYGRRLPKGFHPNSIE